MAGGLQSPGKMDLFPLGVPLAPAPPCQGAQQAPEQGHLDDGQEHHVQVAEQEPVQGAWPEA